MADQVVLQGPTAKEKKYDRQLRLWGANGQQALEVAHILLLNSGPGAVGVETLKNLVLPGIGSFTIVDSRLVQTEDLGVNFFLEESSLGRSRAEEMCKLLKELNPEVKGYAVQQSIVEFLEDHKSFEYTLILLIAPVQSKVLQRVSDLADEHEVPLFYVHSNGFYSQFAVQNPGYGIMDTHPDASSTQDLRLLKPWPQLLEHMKQKTSGLETMSDHEHGHVPWVLLLLHYLEAWKESHAGKVPETYQEKTVFRELVSKGARRHNAEGGEENFDEAVAAVLKSLKVPRLEGWLGDVFKHLAERGENDTSPSFWIIAHATEKFYDEHQELPLSGTIPDMKAQSADYIELQHLYKTKAAQDVAAITIIVRQMEMTLQRPHPTEIREIEAFCKNAGLVRFILPNRLRCKLHSAAAHDFEAFARKVMRAFADNDSLITIYLAYLGLDHYLDSNPHPDFTPHAKRHLDADACQSKFLTALTAFTSEVLARCKAIDAAFDAAAAESKVKKIIAELDRTGAAELHNISALTGGLVAQEIIKILTKQYVPAVNTCVFDGIMSKAGVFEL